MDTDCILEKYAMMKAQLAVVQAKLSELTKEVAELKEKDSQGGESCSPHLNADSICSSFSVEKIDESELKEDFDARSYASFEPGDKAKESSVAVSVSNLLGVWVHKSTSENNRTNEVLVGPNYKEICFNKISDRGVHFTDVDGREDYCILDGERYFGETFSITKNGGIKKSTDTFIQTWEYDECNGFLLENITFKQKGDSRTRIFERPFKCPPNVLDKFVGHYILTGQFVIVDNKEQPVSPGCVTLHFEKVDETTLKYRWRAGKWAGGDTFVVDGRLHEGAVVTMPDDFSFKKVETNTEEINYQYFCIDGEFLTEKKCSPSKGEHFRKIYKKV